MTPPSPDVALQRGETERTAQQALDGQRLERVPALRLAAGLRDPDLREPVLRAAEESARRGFGDVVSVSRNIFIPLTNLCRDRCAYCTFAKLPDSPEAQSYDLEMVAEAVRGGIATGCIEALFCLGDKPEVAYRSHREWLQQRGYASTAEHLVQACQVAFEGGMLPHTNAGVLSQDEMARLRPWNASLGLMLESTSRRLRGRGMAHHHAPDKEPALRLRMHEQAGELRIPFTSGILIGIGETNAERVDTLLALRALDDRFGHIQEVIVQPFHPKPGTRMRAASSLSNGEVAGWVAMARLILGSHMSVQAPPNLAPDMLERLLRSGLNDWGGVSPVSLDFVNPEAPWPKLEQLRSRTEATGRRLVERLPVYPKWVLERPGFFDPQVRAVLSRFANDAGFARDSRLQSSEEAA